MELSAMMDFVQRVAKEAGDNILLKGYHSEKREITYKSRTNLVTNIDKESEKYIVDKLGDQYKDIDVMAEEGSQISNSSDLVWFVDPLDATNNFAHGIPHFCVSIGLYSRRDEKTLLGVVYDPFKKEMFSAIDGGGAFLNGKKILVSEIKEVGYSLLATGFPYLKEVESINNLHQFNKILPRTQGVRRMGSAALDLCYVAAGRLEGYWEPMLYPWDVSAGSLIVEEAGGRVTNYNGGLFRPEYKEIVATNGLVHDELLELIGSSTAVYPGEYQL